MTLCHLFFLSLYSPGLWSRRSFKMWTSSASKTLQHKFSCYCFCIKFWRHFQDDKQWRRSFWLHYSTQSNQRKTTNDGSHKPDGQGQRVDAVRLDAPGHSSRGQRVSIILTVTMIKRCTSRKKYLPTLKKTQTFSLDSCDPNFAHCLKITPNVAFEFWHFPPIFVY